LSERFLNDRMIQAQQFDIRPLSRRVTPSCEPNQRHAVSPELIEVVGDAHEALAAALPGSTEETDDAIDARGHVRERFVVFQAEAFQILEELEDHLARL